MAQVTTTRIANAAKKVDGSTMSCQCTGTHRITSAPEEARYISAGSTITYHRESQIM
jgi:hypothetical protein